MQKIISVMIRIVLLLLIGFLHVSATCYSQGTITLKEKNAPITKIFSAIESQSGYIFLYKKELVENLPLSNIDISDATINQVLEICLKNMPLTYSIVDKIIVLKIKEPAQAANIMGKIINEKGEPVAGATINIKNTRRTVQSDANGNFILQGISDNAILLISNVGYESQEIIPGNNTHIIIKLVTSVSKLDEIQIIAYGSTTKRLNTGDAGTINAETIAEQPVSNPLAAMEGRVPGLFITQGTGVSGGSFTVQIRGQNSIANGNDPLYIIDGVPFTSISTSSSFISASITGGGNPLNNINPSDIESIDILKDADATAIYGSRGANGVILITTKKGKAGKTKTDVSMYTGFGKITRGMKLLNTAQYLEMRHEAFKNDGETPDPTIDYDLLSWDTTSYTDWEKKLIGGTSHISDIQGSVSGGNENTQFRIGGGYHREGSVFPGDFYEQKGSGYFNLNHNSENRKFICSLTATFVSDNNHQLSTDLTNQAVSLAPDAPAIFDSSGKLNWANGTFNNPFGNIVQKFTSSTGNLISNAALSYELLPGLRLKADGGYTNMQTRESLLFPLSSFNPSYGLTSGQSYFSSSSVETWIFEPQVTYHRNLNHGVIDVLGGSTFQQTNSDLQTLLATGFLNDALLMNIAAAATISPFVVNNALYRYNAFFARLNYNLSDKYIVNLTGRRDGSSRFGPGKQFADFGAVGAAWIFSKESFVKNLLGFLSYGKLRASYGITGNDQIGDYKYLDTYAPFHYNYQGQPVLTPTRLSNPDYGWETNKKMELGLETGYLKNRILFDISYFINRSSNQLVGYPLAPTAGFTSVTANLPAVVQNTGTEISINTVNLKSKDFSWTSSLTLTIPRNKLLSYPNLAGSGYGNTYVIGQPITIVKLFNSTGVNDSTGVYQFKDNKGSLTYNPSYSSDRTVVVNTSPRFYGGFQNSIRFKNIQMDIFLQFIKQQGSNYLYNANPAGLAGINQPVIIEDRWQKAGDVARFQQFSQDYGSNAVNTFYSYAQSSNLSFGDASYMRLKNISISYQFPAPLLKQNHVLQAGKVFLQAQNLFTVTSYFGLDPENSGAALPPLRVITGGVQFTF